jgi:hypothetical protein
VSKLSFTTPVGYPLEVFSYSTIHERLLVEEDRWRRGTSIRTFRPDQLNDIVVKVVDKDSEVNTIIEQQTNYKLTTTDLTYDRLKDWENSSKWWDKKI